MKTIIPLFSIVLAFLFVTVSPQAQATCQDACLTNDNTVQGDDALISLTTGTDNTAIGFDALYSNTSGFWNTAIGSGALFSNIGGIDPEGNYNTATGVEALYSNTTGSNNTANGFNALYSNTTSSSNTATGANALFSNTIGGDNTANGNLALYHNTSGGVNTATGVQALYNNTTGSYNTATGCFALAGHYPSHSSFNTATGYYALLNDTAGDNNTAMGANAALHDTVGSENTAVGFSALINNRAGSSNIALGSMAGFNLDRGNNNIHIGNVGFAGETEHIRIGTEGTQTATYIAGISGATVPTGVTVIVDSNGQLGTTTSSARYKDAIKPMDKASEAILSLKPVTFRYKHELDPQGIPQFGLVAEDVEKVNPDLVARDEQGKPYTVRYEAVNAMLLNEFLKDHRKVESLEKAMAEQQKENATMRAMLKEQAAQIQKVSAQLELSKPAPHAVVDND